MSRFDQQSTIDPRNPRCRQCDTMTSVYWRVPARDLLLCNNCFLQDSRISNQFCKLKRIDTNIEDLPTFENRFQFSNQINKDEQLVSSSSSSSSSTITKSKRSKIIEPIKSQIPVKISTRQQPAFRSNRKTLAFKSKKPEKCLSQSTTFKLYDVLYSKRRRFEVGDIVYLIDANFSCFYAQIRALFQDEHVNAFAFLTWLLPTTNKTSTNNFQFDPNAYSIGPNEEYPRSLSSLSFVCHAPSDYFQVKTYPQSATTDNRRSFNYTWTQVFDSNNENDYSSTSSPMKRRRFV
ncbi:unnamed protein product [Rotaria magnacalcarata]|uniref:GATA zinc finger domain-containing protein 1 n=6 Tax=Rotaria magnacalcarata TaxID=392030 RepID=A0A815INU7_9BILA|nr:unnamed protein product [Rotaria magnacalcarata]CAF1657112.1 unnamed protein product [Rotaria magnacalcarata]CAF2147012.1 unnamed protein product [Rotaria magnacalcarata]